MLRDAAEIADRAGVRRFASVQDQLNLLARKAVDDTLPACADLGMAFLPYYPLASGILTGKYRRGEQVPAGTRLADQVSGDLRDKMLSERTFARLDALESFAADAGHSLLELAYAWLLGLPSVASVISGASKPGQPASNSAAATWQLTPDEVTTVTQIVAGAT
jgi:aryl-alcohol dehydrogenase-like predicted oxidoreductase